jgi:hypothetical protein
MFFSAAQLLVLTCWAVSATPFLFPSWQVLTRRLSSAMLGAVVMVLLRRRSTKNAQPMRPMV